MKNTLLVIGASRGIGAAVSKHFYNAGHRVIGVSRTPAAAGDWIQVDISNPKGICLLVDRVGETPIDALLFMGGIWEKNAFTQEFDFRKSSYEETRLVLVVNLIAPIEITKGLSKNLASASNPRAIYIGSLSGLDQSASPEVANTASKFGLRGAIQALRLALQQEHIGFTVINPGNVATEEVLADIRALSRSDAHTDERPDFCNRMGAKPIGVG
jgi:NAD(P)-dependent dehydrogenase (short-subunit alcohol dehydrogenase family)